MAQALLTGVFLGLIGLVTTAVFGLRGTDISRHISYGIFSTPVAFLIGPDGVLEQDVARGGAAILRLADAALARGEEVPTG